MHFYKIKVKINIMNILLNLINPKKCFKYSFSFMLFLIILLTISLSYHIIDLQIISFKERTENFKKTYTDTQIENLRNIVQSELRSIKNLYKNIDFNEEKLLNIVSKELKYFRFGNNAEGYIFILKINNLNDKNTFAHVLYHPIDNSLIGQRITFGKNKLNNNLHLPNVLSDLTKDGNTIINYLWQKPNADIKKHEKITFFQYDKELNWIIGAGIYQDDLNLVINKNRNDFYEKIKKEIFLSILFIIICSVFAYYIALYFSKQLQLAFEYFQNEINKKKQELENLNKNLEKKVEDQIIVIKKNYTTDSLTGLKNRSLYFKTLKNMKQNCLITIDIDNFKELNDTFGYKSANALLIEISKRLKNYLQKDDLLFRVGSDEFAIIKNLEIKEQKTFIENLHTFISDKPFNYKHKLTIHFNTTIVLTSKEQGDNIHQLNDMTMSVAKNKNKNTLIYNEKYNLEQQFEHNIKMIDILKTALDNDQIVPYFQAIVDNNTQEPYKYETLVRIKTVNKIFSPIEFLSISKKAKLYPKITLVLFDKIIQNLKNNEKLNLSMNLSYEDIINNEIREHIYKNVTPFIAKRLTFELLESESIDNYDNVIEFIDKMKEKGSKIAIDDFGSGYSNFDHIIKLKVDYLKIDGSLIKDIDRDEDIQVMVKSIISFCESLEIKVIGEFVCNNEVYKKVKELGINYSQGYYFHKPSDKI
jgi:diguanylate cyclase (GGDEF)-like protein